MFEKSAPPPNFVPSRFISAKLKKKSVGPTTAPACDRQLTSPALHTGIAAKVKLVQALSLENHVGTLEPGTDADIVVLDAGATPGMALRMETIETLAEELFLLQTLGDDRAVAAVYVAGRTVKG